MGIITATIAAPANPIDFIGERLSRGDTEVFVDKLNRYMSELKAWGLESNAAFGTIDTFMIEVDSKIPATLSAVIVPTATMDFTTENIVKGDTTAVVTKINDYMAEAQAFSVINEAAFDRVALIVGELETALSVTLPTITVPAALDFDDELLVSGDTDAFVEKMSSYAAEIELWGTATNAAFEAVLSVSYDINNKLPIDPALAEFGGVLTGSSHTFTVVDPFPVAGRRYDLYINDVDQGPSIVYPVVTFAITGLPTDGTLLDLRLRTWDNDDTEDDRNFLGTATAYNSATVYPTDGMTQLVLPTPDVTEGNFGSTEWAALISPLTSAFWEASGTAITTVETIDSRLSLGVRLDNSTVPSTRECAGATITASQVGRVSQWVYFDAGFDWGGTNEGGNLGVGWGGGARKMDGTGGSGDSDTQSGFTSRFSWSAGGAGLVTVYDANTTTEGTPVSMGVTFPRGSWFHLAMEVTMNTGVGVSDGKLKVWYNGNLLINQSTRKWYGTASVNPIQVDTLLHCAYHYGSDATWSPGRTNHLYFADMYWGDEYANAPAFAVDPYHDSLTSSTVSIYFTADQKVAAYTEMRANGGAWYIARREDTFAYESHIQRPSDLQSGTYYEYRVTITNTAGGSITSEIVTFTTADAAEGDDALLMRGIMSGSRNHGWRLNHNELSRCNHVAIRFVAEESGNLVRISKHNRQGSGYHEGNGGNYHVRILPSVNGLPDESTVLGQSNTADSYILTSGPSTGSDRIWVDIDSPPAPLVVGQEYFAYWDSRTEQGNGKSIFNSTQVGDYYQIVSGITDRGPYPGANDMKTYDKRNKGDEWKSTRPYLIPWVCFEMSSGRIRGNCFYGGYYGQNLDGSETKAASRTIAGGQVARQEWTAARDVTLDGIWVFFGQTYKYTIDGSPLTITLRDGSGTSLATGSIAASTTLNDICKAGELASDLEARTTRTWVYSDLSVPVSTVQGQVYRLELSSGALGGFTMSASFPWPKTAHTGNKYTDGIWERTQMWPNSKALIVSEGQWTPGSPYNDDAREMDIIFTHQGQPKRMY